MNEIDATALTALIEQQQTHGQFAWLMIAAALVLLMQVGFLLLEAGMVRSKNSINVAQKNISDFLISVSTFYLVGFGLMFGSSFGGWFGTDLFAMNANGDWTYAFFVFQAVFVGTAATIVSGAVAERMKYSAYIGIAFLTSLVIYPVFGHFVWGNLLNPDNPAYLADKGFLDFAGSTVVHSTGAWIGLAGIIVLGPRLGKFNPDGTSNTIQGHSYVLAAAGAIILWFGWFGFNGGGANPGNSGFALIIINTLLAATFGGTASVLLGRVTDHQHIPIRPINGSLAGLVGITASCDVVLPLGAMVIGAICGFLVVGAERFLERVFKLDDVVGAVSVHGVCGAAGSLLLALFAVPEKLAVPTRWGQFLAQLEGVSINFVWAFGIAFCAFKLMDMLSGIRVSEHDELSGLNAAEHGASLGTESLQKEVRSMIKGRTDLTRRLDETSGDEAAEIAKLFNPFVDKVHDLIVGIKAYADVLQASSAELEGFSASFSEMSQETSSISSELSNTTGDASARARSSSELTSGIRQKASDIARNAQNMSDEVCAVSEAVTTLTGSIARISNNADQTSNITQNANALSQRVDETMKVLGSASREAAEVVEIIQEVSFKTNILAINASIEAARAGFAGKGFAVVAQEVRQLSEETSKAAETVQARIKHIQTQSHDAEGMISEVTGIMEQIHHSVSEISTSVNEQQIATGEILDMVTRASGNAGDVATAITDVAGSTATVADNTSTNVRTLDEAAQLANSLKEKAVTSSGRAEDVFSSSQHMAAISRDLSDSVNQFRTKIPDKDKPANSEIDTWEDDAKNDRTETEFDDTGS